MVCTSEMKWTGKFQKTKGGGREPIWARFSHEEMVERIRASYYLGKKALVDVGVQPSTRGDGPLGVNPPDIPGVSAHRKDNV